MSHLDGRTFPQRIALGATVVTEWGIEEVRTDGGFVKRNQRWATPLRSFQLTMPPMRRDDADYVAFLDLWDDSGGGLHSFDYIDHRDQSDATLIAVRFATPITTRALTPDLEIVDTFTLEEVRLPDS